MTSRVDLVLPLSAVLTVGVLVVIPTWRAIQWLKRAEQRQTYREEIKEFAVPRMILAFGLGLFLGIGLEEMSLNQNNPIGRSTFGWFMIMWFVSLIPSAVIPKGNRRRVVIASALTFMLCEIANRNGVQTYPTYLPPSVTIITIVSLSITFVVVLAIANWRDKEEASFALENARRKRKEPFAEQLRKISRKR